MADCEDAASSGVRSAARRAATPPLLRAAVVAGVARGAVPGATAVATCPWYVPLYILEHLVGENIYRYPMSLTSLECQVSELVSSDACSRPTTHRRGQRVLRGLLRRHRRGCRRDLPRRRARVTLAQA